MPRATLSPEEREARRKERSRLSFSEAAYKNRYDPSKEGFGSADEWIRQAEALAEGMTSMRPTTKAHPDLAALYLDEMPADVSALKTAFRNSMFIAHPDHGGTNETARNVMEAYKRLLKVFG
jgi:hypothetical protein